MINGEYKNTLHMVRSKIMIVGRVIFLVLQCLAPQMNCKTAISNP